MGRYTGPSCRQCRREGTKLFLKGTKCFTEKCPVERRPYAAGPARPEHGAPSQGVGVLEAAPREAEDQAHLRRERAAVPQHVREGVARCPGITGHNLLAALESASRQRGVPHGLRRQPQGRAPAHSPPSRRSEQQVASTSRATMVAAGRGSARPREVARAGVA